MNLSPRQKEQINLYFRFFASTVGGGLMITFAYFSLLTNFIIGAVFAVLMFIIGLLIGLYSTEIQYAIISGFFAIFIGLIIVFGTVYLAAVVMNTWSIMDILFLITIDIVVRAFMLQLLGILPGVVIGRLFGPEWLEPEIKHRLKVGIDGKRISEPDKP
ncbi:MAG: hypothetical protein ACFE9D_09330 [Promethearchaeota archaeon]